MNADHSPSRSARQWAGRVTVSICEPSPCQGFRLGNFVQRLLVSGKYAVPAEHIAQMVGESRQDQLVFADDVGYSHGLISLSLSRRSSNQRYIFTLCHWL